MTACRGKSIVLFAGLAILLIGLAFNEWTIAKLFSLDGVIGPVVRAQILGSEAFLILLGSVVIKFRAPISDFMRRHPNFLALGLGISLVAGILLIVEVAYGFINVQRIRQAEFSREEDGQILWQQDKNLGYKAAPHSSIRSVLKKNGKVIEKLEYSIDGFSRRMTPVEREADRRYFALFFGCSVTFGHGVKDNETLPYYFSQFAPGCQPYNYGYPGYGPQQMLAKLEDDRIQSEIPQKDGILIYTFIDHHVQRSIGSMSVYSRWGARMPYYTWEGDRLIRKGNFATGRPFLSLLYRLFGFSQILHYYEVDFPRTRPSDIQLTAKIIEESGKRFRDKFKSEDFYVVFFPGSGLYVQSLKSYFDKLGVKYLDYSELLDKREGDFYLPGDGHPNSKGYFTVARKLAEDLAIPHTFEAGSLEGNKLVRAEGAPSHK